MNQANTDETEPGGGLPVRRAVLILELLWTS